MDGQSRFICLKIWFLIFILNTIRVAVIRVELSSSNLMLVPNFRCFVNNSNQIVKESNTQGT